MVFNIYGQMLSSKEAGVSKVHVLSVCRQHPTWILQHQFVGPSPHTTSALHGHNLPWKTLLGPNDKLIKRNTRLGLEINRLDTDSTVPSCNIVCLL